MAITRKNQKQGHHAARDRLFAEIHAEPLHLNQGSDMREIRCQAAALLARAVYDAALERMFLGHTSSWEVLCARIAWNVAESHLVDARAHRPKPNERR